MTEEQNTLTIALAGQPNVGKSSVFNALTGLSQYVSNWPGKTCEQKTGIYQRNGDHFHIVDLPGVYSLSANSVEEIIARDFIIKCRPDVIIVVIDAVSLERNLYLVAELLSQPAPLVIGLNRLDLAAQQGMIIEPHVLQAALGLPVIPMVASRSQGVEELIEAVKQVVAHPEAQTHSRPEIRQDHQEVLRRIEALIKDHVPDPLPVNWVAIKLLEGDEEITTLMRQQLGESWKDVDAILLAHEDAFLAVICGRYEWIGRMVRAAVVQPKTGQLSLTDRIDRFATHPVWGMLLLLAALGLLFWLTYAVGAPVQNWLEINLVQSSADWVNSRLTNYSPWLAGLIAHGIIAGVGTVLTLLPILLIFLAFLGMLEDVGYMARAAFVMDRFMHLMGLHGKSFLPIFLGFGCNVPAVMGSRIIEDQKARLTTIMVAPIVPCTARMSVVAFLAPIFFGVNALWVSWGLILLSLTSLTGFGVLLHKKILGGEQSTFIMELPLYHAPNLKIVLSGVWQRLADFVQTAGSIILVVSIILWALSTFPHGTIEDSYLAFFGRLLAPIGGWMGLEWPMMVALLTSFVRKENTIPTLAILYSSAQNGSTLAQSLNAHLAPAAALAFLAVQILFIPCVATLATIRQETRSWRWTLFNSAFLLVLSFLVGIAIYQGARLLSMGT